MFSSVRSNTDILNVAIFKYSLHNFRETIVVLFTIQLSASQSINQSVSHMWTFPFSSTDWVYKHHEIWLGLDVVIQRLVTLYDTWLYSHASAHRLQADNSVAPAIIRASMDHCQLVADWSTDTIMRTLSLYCTTPQQQVLSAIVSCGWPTLVQRLAQRSPHYQSFN